MNLNIKQLSILAISAFLLVACQQEEKKPEASPAQETQKPVAEIKPKQSSSAEAHAHDHPEVIASGEKYEVVEPQATCEKPVVMEFFAYHCPHCNDLEPAAQAWREKVAGKVEFISVPTHLGHQQYGSLLLAHHAAKKLGTLEKTQHALFNRVHKERKLFGSEEELAQFLADNGADLAEAKAVLADQGGITESIRADFDMLNKYKITSVPKVLVNHKYMTDITMAGGHKQVFEIVDQVLAMESSCAK